MLQVCPCTKYASHFFFSTIFPNSLGIPLLFCAAIWFSVLFTCVIKLCMHIVVISPANSGGEKAIYSLATFPCSAGQEEEQNDKLFS